MTRRWPVGLLGAALGAGATALLYARLVERAWVRLDRFTVEIDRPGIPPEGLTILHLSDFHFRASGTVQARKIARLQRLLANERYDILALTGDLIHDAAGFPAALALIDGLKPRVGAYFCPGNHDYCEYTAWGILGPRSHDDGADGRPVWSRAVALVRDLLGFAGKLLHNDLVRLPVIFNDVPAMLEALDRHGVQPLVNCAVRVPMPGAGLWIAGLDDLTEGRPDLHAALANVPDGAPVILLAHNPDAWLEPGVERAGLVLSGHTHGGQVRLPGIGAAHTQGTHLTRRRPAGWFERGPATRMFVSRGLGESIPLRFGAPPQAALIRVVRR